MASYQCGNLDIVPAILQTGQNGSGFVKFHFLSKFNINFGFNNIMKFSGKFPLDFFW